MGDKANSANAGTVAVGQKASATGSQGIAIGENAVAEGNYSEAIGLGAKATVRSSVALGHASETSAPVSTRTVTVGGQTYSVAGSSAYSTVSVGSDNIKRTITNVAAGRVAEDSTDAVNGSELYAVVSKVNTNTADIATNAANIATNASNIIKVRNETRTTADGNYTRVSNTAGQNIMALDTQVKQNADAITNVDNQVTYLGNRLERMDHRIDRVGAGAAALAALHPQDFAPEDKWDFAAGYGHYRSSDALAIGAFYRPNGQVMFSIGGSMGDGENMFNAGMSLKFGQSSPYAGYSKAALTTVIAEQKKQLDAQASTISGLKSQNAELNEKLEKQQAQIEDIMHQLEELKK